MTTLQRELSMKGEQGKDRWSVEELEETQMGITPQDWAGLLRECDGFSLRDSGAEELLCGLLTGLGKEIGSREYSETGPEWPRTQNCLQSSPETPAPALVWARAG